MSLLGHTINIITKPKAEWEVIKTETMSIKQIFVGYVCILSAIPAIASFLSLSIIGITISNPFGPSFSFKFSIGAGAITAITSYVLGLVGVYVAAMVVSALAKSFESTPDMGSATKLVAFAYTPSWLAGIFGIYSPISWLSIVGLYSIVLIYFGLGPMMNTPQGKKMGYMIVSAIIVIVIMVVISVIVGIVTPKPSLESLFNQMNFDIK
jgi:hypothetical protein